MDPEKIDPNEQFFYNLMLAKALVQVMPASIRQYIRIWFDALLELDQSPGQHEVRNEYIWFILLMLQTNRVHDYFKNLPPTYITPLRNAIPQSTIDEVLLASDQNMSWLEKLSDEEKKEKVDKKKIPPEDFLVNQPIPKDGIICYFAAFSDQG